MDDDTSPERSRGAAERKRELRSASRAARASLDPSARERLGAGWAAQVARLVVSSDARTVALYLSYGTEPPTAPLLEALTTHGVRVLVPVLLEDRDLDWVDHSRPDVVLGRDAIAEAGLVVVPALV